MFTATFEAPAAVARTPNRDLPQRLEEMRRTVRRVVSHTTPHRILNERRSDRRFPIAVPLQVTPLDERGARRDAEAFVVIGRNLSERGLDFFHQAPVAERFVIVWLPVALNQHAGLILELTWCRFGGMGWYENGGKFILPPPDDAGEWANSLRRGKDEPAPSVP